MITAIYPGTFDPITLGHLDIIDRASKIFDRLVVSVVMNPEKHPLFEIDERVELIKKVVAKVAQGGGQCEEVLAAVDDRQQTVVPDTPFAASWAAADQLYADLGIATSSVSDDRDWDTIYSEAMDERYRQKVMIL